MNRAEYWTQHCLRVFLLTWLCLVAGDICHAGCSFAHRRAATAEVHPREHARHFRFLGQWVYERGQIKYAIQSENETCDGPDCHASAPVPQPHAIAPQPNTRTSNSLMGATQLANYASPVPFDRVDLLSESAIALYYAVPLQPPR